MKRSFLLLSFLLLIFPLSAQKYQINDVVYSIQGCGHWIFGTTQRYALEQEVPVDKKTVFNNEEELTNYINNLQIKLQNLRAFETINIIYTTDSTQEDSEVVIPVTLTISVKDSFHLFAIPGPKYDSNTGLTFKLKIKDSNFLGTLNTLSSDFFYSYTNR